MVATLEFIWGAVNEAFTEHSGSSLCKYKGYRTVECSLGLVSGALAAAPLILAELAGTISSLRFFRHPMEEESSARALPPVDVEADGEDKGVFVVSVALGWTRFSLKTRESGVSLAFCSLVGVMRSAQRFGGLAPFTLGQPWPVGRAICSVLPVLSAASIYLRIFSFSAKSATLEEWGLKNFFPCCLAPSWEHTVACTTSKCIFGFLSADHMGLSPRGR